MEEIDDEDSPQAREQRRDSAIRFCRNTMIFVFVTTIGGIFFALLLNHWDTNVLRSKYMVIGYVVELFIFMGGISVAVTGWQEK